MNERESIGARLREDRKRLGLKQDQLGITPQVQRRYEAGTSTPGADYLAAFAELGGDVLYVITGQRAVGAVAADEAALIEAYRSAPEAVRKAALGALLAGRASDTSITIKGGVGSIVRGDATFGDINLGGKKAK